MRKVVISRKRVSLIALSLAPLLSVTACGAGSDPVAAPVTAAPIANAAAACTKLSPKIGQTATLSTRSHGVTGTAKIVDDCTIEIANFSYDGGGLPDVFFYGAKSSNYATGFAIGENQFGKKQANSAIKLTLKDKELDNIDGISLWCIRASVSFGDGLFK
jgi:Electron transfer DM13